MNRLGRQASFQPLLHPGFDMRPLQVVPTGQPIGFDKRLPMTNEIVLQFRCQFRSSVRLPIAPTPLEIAMEGRLQPERQHIKRRQSRLQEVWLTLFTTRGAAAAWGLRCGRRLFLGKRVHRLQKSVAQIGIGASRITLRRGNFRMS